MKRPDECTSIEEIRSELDRIDREIIAAIGGRFAYVKAMSKFKTSETHVRAPGRFKSMLLQRREWAAEEGLNPDAIESLYRDLVNYFIEEELKEWEKKPKGIPLQN